MIENTGLYDIEKFKLEMDNEIERPCDKPYDISGYDKKNQKILRDIDLNHNHSWIKEIWNRNKNNLKNTAIFYRGQKFSYEDFFVNSYKFARALKTNGLKKGQEFICCIENTPEFPFIMGAASILGARVNLLSADMDQDYLINIINNATSPFIFVTDKNFIEFSSTLAKVDKSKRIINLPLDYSLKNGNPYKEITEKYYKLDEEKFNECLNKFDNVENIDEFLKSGQKFEGTVYNPTGLNDVFTITYTSGSTNSNKPKGLMHRVRSYISMGRYHDPEISKVPSMKNKRMLALVRTMSDTDFMSAVSDVFMQSGNVALEPVNDKDFILETILINKPTVFLTSRSVWIETMKKQMNNKCYKNIKFPSLMVPMCIGEPLDANEEKVLNKWLRSLKAGVDVTKLPNSVVSMSIAGGDSEHGGIFITLFRELQTKIYKNFGIKEPVGMGTYGMVEVKALREDGTYCDYMEPGHLVANSPCTMEGYVNNAQGDKEFFITDAYGKKWANLNTYGYVDKFNHTYVKGRINSYDANIPNYKVASAILKDTKKIMSCEVVNVEDDGNKYYVAHIEPQMFTSINIDSMLLGAANRCKLEFGTEFLDNLYFRVRSNEESFPVSPTLKRSFLKLIEEGISDKCIKATDILNVNKRVDDNMKKSLKK